MEWFDVISRVAEACGEDDSGMESFDSTGEMDGEVGLSRGSSAKSSLKTLGLDNRDVDR